MPQPLYNSKQLELFFVSINLSYIKYTLRNTTCYKVLNALPMRPQVAPQQRPPKT